LGTPFSYAVIAVVSFMQGDYASLDLFINSYCFLWYSCFRFAQDCDTFDQAKVARLSPPMRRGKELCRAFDLHIAAIRLIYLTAPRPLGTPKGDRDKQSKAPAAHRLSIAFLLSLLGKLCVLSKLML